MRKRNIININNVQEDFIVSRSGDIPGRFE